MKKNSLLTLAFTRRWRLMQYDHANPLAAQEKIFNYLIKEGAKTAWGKIYNYREIKNYEDYRQRVPISDYESLRPYIDQLLQGRDYVLWSEKIKYFSKSSGTTGSKSKYIPVSNAALKDNHYAGGRSLFASYFHHYPQSKIFLGRNFALGGNRQYDPIGSSKYIADVSVILMKNLPWWARLRRSPRFSVAAMPEWETKLNRIAEIITYQNIVSLSGVPSWNLILAKKILEISEKKNLHQVWPNLELFIHGGTSFAPYREQFQKLMPSSMNYLEVYNASEGFFAFQDDLSRSDLLLFLNGGVFYEFLPLEELAKAKPRALSLEEVELDKNYALVISTNAGLWRYLIGDTVRFTSLAPFRIVLSGRTKSFINACGEELVVENADKAVAQAAQLTGALVKEYTAAPYYHNKTAAATHQWLFEFEKAPSDSLQFMRLLDNELKKSNSDYEAKRYKDLNLAPPLLVIAKKDLFYHWLKEKNRLGGQAKIPRLSNDRILIDHLLTMNEAL